MKSEKSVLVTGASQRLGACIARAFAGAGWRVFCHYDQSRELAEALVAALTREGHQAVAVQASLADEAGCASLMQQVRLHTAHLDCLINNASTFVADTATSFDATLATHQLQVNLLAPLSLASHLARELAPAPGAEPACVIHILDQKVFNLNPDYFSYTMSKLALERAVALQAQALAPSVRVAGVAPGLMYLSGPQDQHNFELASRANLLRRPTDPQDVADTCLFLARTTGITGTVISVDNGQHLVPLPRDIMFVVDDLLQGKTS
jgi:NAD(P)-dependent dehydrogenase (short-subunit alcohol dehydrogenase family)